MERPSIGAAIAQANDLLSKTPEYYLALDAKGLSLCGLVLCAAQSRLVIDQAGMIADAAQAAQAFQKARRIAPEAGIVMHNLRLFDELAKCDEEGNLKDVRKAVDGKG